jgi:hypothetical protein
MFTLSRPIPQGKKWSGCLNAFRLRAKKTATTTVRIT